MSGGDHGHAARVVAGADVLAADLLVGGPARAALDLVRAHSWVDLLASDHLLADAAAVVDELADSGLATDWRDRAERECVIVDHPPDDHPGLATAYRGEAGHLLSFDPDLSGTAGNLGVQSHMRLSVRPPAAFAGLFDPESLYEAVVGGEYPGPDRDPRG